MMDGSSNNIDKHKVRTPELDDYLVLLSYLDKLEARIVELEKRLLSGQDSMLH
jgi:hypothetical protein